MFLKLLIKLTGARKPRIALRKGCASRGKRIWCAHVHYEPPVKFSEIPASIVNMYLNGKALKFAQEKD